MKTGLLTGTVGEEDTPAGMRTTDSFPSCICWTIIACAEAVNTPLPAGLPCLSPALFDKFDSYGLFPTYFPCTVCLFKLHQFSTCFCIDTTNTIP